ncbi:MAG: radical SAM protein [Candidatus Latescibacterota bacterium]
MKHPAVLKVIEIFASIQGESSLQGFPCVFIRLSGCNLRCRYCDTAYAYEGGAGMTIPEIIDRVAGHGISLVCITGGEPLLQEATPGLARKLLTKGFRVSVETNGSLDASFLPPETVRIIDIKCPESGEAGKTHPRNLEGVRPGDEFKFVLADRADFEYARKFVRGHRLAERGAALFSPAWGMLEPSILAEWIVREMPEARLNLPLHKCIWPDDPRGR